MTNIKAGIAGAAGYTGGELIRLLLNHPHVALGSLLSRSSAGMLVSSVHHDLVGETELFFTDTLDKDLDILFLCLGHGESGKFIEEYTLGYATKIIDLSNDFRLSATSNLGGRNFIYGLPELNRAVIKSATNIANPGCFATAIQLGLLPLAKSGLLTEVYTTGITGSTGAGQKPSETSQFSWRANNIQAYKTHTHQHLAEIEQSLQQVQAQKNKVAIHFVPWRGDFTRGIFISSQLKCLVPLEEINAMYDAYYKDEPFIHLTGNQLFLKQVVNTNKCLIQLEKVDEHLIIHSAMDNLIKGASGQAIQNMNIMCGFDEAEGLRLKASYF